MREKILNVVAQLINRYGLKKFTDRKTKLPKSRADQGK